MNSERQRLEGDPAGAAATLRRVGEAGPSVAVAVREILAEVRDGGDAAVSELERRFGGGDAPESLRIEPGELAGAVEAADPQLCAGLKLAAANVREVAAASVGEDRTVELPQGQRMLLREQPVRRAAVYVPGGRAPYPSTVVMGAVTARVAGVEQVAVCAPPGPGGNAHPEILAACAVCGVDEVYSMGGAQAIAALAYGTESVAPVDVVVGPGNPYVQEAKRQLCGVIGIDGVAGPSELLAILDEDPDARLVALDLLAQAEHGDDSPVLAVSPSAEALDAVADAIAELAPADAPSQATCRLLDVSDLDAALAFAEAFAPEHLQLMGPGAEALAPRVRSAGCVFVGAAAGTAFGDYVAGSNHVLPTGGAARFASALSPRHFRRRMAEVRLGDGAGAGAAELARAGAAIARAEGFEFHAQSMEARIGENDER